MKKERGSITIITLTTILFMIAFLVSTFTIIANRRQVQAEIKQGTKKVYEAEIDDIDKIYEGYFAEENAVIPIYTAEQLLEVGTGKDMLINNYIYTLGATKKYKLMSNIELDVTTYLSEYSTMFEDVDGVKKWIGVELPNGTFDYNKKTIIETDSEGNKIIHPKINYVEYIESTSTGGQYIDTGIKPSSNITFELSMALNDVSKVQGVFGAREGIYINSYAIFFNNAVLRWDYDEVTTSTKLKYSAGSVINITKTANQITFETDGQTETIEEGTTEFTVPGSICIFTIDDDTRYADMKLYYCKIYQNGTIVRDFAPALDANGVPCLYEKVTNKYFYNANTNGEDFNYQ